jgi:FkbM family methyltransferase
MSNAILKTAARTARLLPGPLRQLLYRLGPITRLIRRTLSRAAPQGLTEVEIAAGPIAGYRMILDLQTEKEFWLGTYEPQLQQALADFAGPGMTVFDIGANIGYVSLLMAAAVGESGQVYAFEALPENVERLTEHVRLNGLEGTIAVTHTAVTDSVRPVRFRPGPSHATGRAAGGEDDDPEDCIDVPGISIDHFVTELGNPPPDLVKIDIEGGEALALPGMVRTLNLTRPVVFLELHGETAGAAVLDTLHGAGYKIHAMGPAYPPVENPGTPDRKAYLVCLPTHNP